MIRVRVVKTSRDGYVLKWRDSAGERQRKARGGTQRARETERRKLEEELNDRASEMSLGEFWSEYKTDHLSGLSSSFNATSRTMHTRLCDSMKRLRLQQVCSLVSKRAVLAVEAAMRKTDVEPATIKSNMATLWTMIRWGQDRDLIPDFRRPRKRKGKSDKQAANVSKSKGRSLLPDEVRRMRLAIPISISRTERPTEFTDAMVAMLLMGLRLSECHQFSWKPKTGCHYPIALHTSEAAIQFADTQKSGVDCVVPLTDKAVRWLRRIKRRSRSNWPFRTVGQKGEHKTWDRLGRSLSEAGKRSGIVVKVWEKPGGQRIKYASAHDLRRTFATNLQTNLSIPERQRMTRHADPLTLLDNYWDAPTPVLMAKLRGE